MVIGMGEVSRVGRIHLQVLCQYWYRNCSVLKYGVANRKFPEVWKTGVGWAGARCWYKRAVEALGYSVFLPVVRGREVLRDAIRVEECRKVFRCVLLYVIR